MLLIAYISLLKYPDRVVFAFDKDTSIILSTSI